MLTCIACIGGGGGEAWRGRNIILVPHLYSLSFIHIHLKVTRDVLCVETGGLIIGQ